MNISLNTIFTVVNAWWVSGCFFFFLEENTFEFHEGSILSQYFNSHFQSFAPSFANTNAHMLFVKGEVKDGKKCSYQDPSCCGGFWQSEGNSETSRRVTLSLRATRRITAGEQHRLENCVICYNMPVPTPTQPSQGLTLLESLTSLIITAENMDPYTAGHKLT